MVVRDVIDRALIPGNMARTLIRLPEDQRGAVLQLWDEIERGEVHPATSLLDLTPAQLVEEYKVWEERNV